MFTRFRKNKLKTLYRLLKTETIETAMQNALCARVLHQELALLLKKRVACKYSFWKIKHFSLRSVEKWPMFVQVLEEELKEICNETTHILIWTAAKKIALLCSAYYAKA